MTAIFKHRGEAIDHVPSADIGAGDVVVQGELVGVAKLDIKAETLGALHVSGVFDVPKATGESTAIPAGTKVYWDEAEVVAKADDETGANKLLGKSVSAAGDNAATVRVRLSQ